VAQSDIVSAAVNEKKGRRKLSPKHSTTSVRTTCTRPRLNAFTPSSGDGSVASVRLTEVVLCFR